MFDEAQGRPAMAGSGQRPGGRRQWLETLARGRHWRRCVGLGVESGQAKHVVKDLASKA
jgi:hypothetical protein